MTDIRKRKRRPGKTKPRDAAVGVLSLVVAKVAKRRVYYILNLFWGADRRRLRGFPYLLRLDASRVPAAQLVALEAQVRTQLASEAMIDEAIGNVAGMVAALRASGAVSARPVAQSDAVRILGSPAFRGDRLAMLSQAEDRVESGLTLLGGGGGIILAATEAKAFQAIRFIPIGTPGFVTVGFSGVATAGAALVFAGTGGALVGLGINKLADAADDWAGGLARDWTDGDSTSVGELIATTALGRAASWLANGTDPGTGAVGDGDAPPAPSTPAPAPPSPPAPTPSPTATDKSDDDDDDDDANGSGETTGDGEAGGEGTTLPPDLDHGTALGNVLLYASTGLLANEVRNQLRALDIFGGGALGAGRERGTFAANVVLDQLIGSGFLKGVERNLSTLRNSRGLRPVRFVGGALDATRLRNFGLVGGPRPLDIIFQGRTARTRQLRRR